MRIISHLMYKMNIIIHFLLFYFCINSNHIQLILNHIKRRRILHLQNQPSLYQYHPLCKHLFFALLLSFPYGAHFIMLTFSNNECRMCRTDYFVSICYPVIYFYMSGTISDLLTTIRVWC